MIMAEDMLFAARLFFYSFCRAVASQSKAVIVRCPAFIILYAILHSFQKALI